MGVNKVVFGAVSIMDISDSTVTADTLAKGKTAYDKAGEKITGTVEKVNCKIYEITLDKSSGWVFLTDLDEEVLAHINDPLFTALLVISSEYEYVSYTGTVFMATNIPIAYAGNYPAYGLANRQTSSSLANQPIYYPANYTGTSTSLGGCGTFRVDGSKYYVKAGDGYVKNGTYRLIFTW